MKHCRAHHAVILLALGVLALAGPAASENPESLFLQPSVPSADLDALRALAGDDAPEVLERLFLREMLRTAPPAPMPLREPREGKASPTDISLVSYDLATGRESRQGDALPFGTGPSTSSGSSPEHPGSELFDVEGALRAAPEGLVDESALRSIEPITPTPPGPLLNSTTYPWRTVVKMLMRFNVSGTNYFYVCSGATVGSFLAWSAGHCVYNHDPNDDGSTADARWASEIWLWPGQTERVYITGLGVDYAEDRPYGEVKAILLRSYTGWVSSEDITWDFAWITLNQRTGDRVGWMGYEWGTTATSLNFDGYPAETPYVPPGEMRQYPGFDPDNVVSYSSRRISMDAFTYGGHSGGPVWRYDGTNRYMQGVNSTSDRMGSANAQRVTSDVNTKTTDNKADDEANRPPTARPELVEYVHSTTAKDLLTNSVIRGETIQLEYNVYNAGFATTNATLDFYASTNNFISSLDYFLGSRVVTLGANQFSNTTTTLTVPASVPAGDYFVGWTMSSSVTEYNSGDWAVIGPEKLSVSDPPPDLHVPALTISQSTVCTNQLFNVNADVHNQGASTSASTTLRYYRSINSVISFSDAQIGTDFVSGLSPGGTSSESEGVSAPSTDGSWWIGACVDSVAGEIVMSNQCYNPGRALSVIPGTLSVSSHTYAVGTFVVRAGHSISAGSGGVVVPNGTDLSYEAESFAFANDFAVHNGASFTARRVPAPAGCP